MNISKRVLARCILLSACAVISAPDFAATMQVFPDEFGGSGNCKLRAAIQAANTNAVVGGCPAGSATGTDTLVLNLGRPYFIAASASDEDNNITGDLDVTSSIIVQGDDTTRTVIVGPEFDRAFHVLTAQGNLTLNDVTIIGGSVLAGSSNDGGVVRKDGAATLTINRSVLRGGSADRGGGIYTPPGSGLLTLNRVTVFDNRANHGGGMFLEQGSGIEAILNNLTVSGNTAIQTGGGLYVANSWFRMRNSTVTRNVSLLSAGGVFYGSPSTTGVNLANSVLLDNIANGVANDLNCAGGGAQLGARSFTMIGSIVGGCTFASFSGIPTSNDARLSPLFDFGSGVPTHALLPSSSALNAGNPSNSNALTACLTADARGVSRTTSCDLGAYEHRFDLTLNSFSDLPDLNPGDGSCLALGNVCTLRAALMEANAVGGRWFINLPAGIYQLNQPIGNNIGDAAGGDLDVAGSNVNDPPLALTLLGSGDPDDTQIVGGGFDRVLEVRGNNGTNDTTLAFALINARISGGALTEDPFAFEPNAVIGGGGIKVYGGKSLFYNVVVHDNVVDLVGDVSRGGGVSISAPFIPEHNRPYASSVVFERFAIIDNTSADNIGGIEGSLGSTSFKSDGITLGDGTIAGNHAVRGGGAYLVNSSLSFVTIAGNTSEMVVVNPTSGYAAGFTGASNILRNVLITGNQAGAVNSDCRVYTTDFGNSNISLGYNLIQTSDPACVISGDTTGNLLDIDPQLGPREWLPTGMPFHRLAATSPAVNAIPRAACSDGKGHGVVNDVRGLPRPGSGSIFCDIGAVENELPMFANSFE
ncbi:MAG: choice-of-anchor Q domain-containing protein [Pseudomonadota bacterium]|nr:choice-of-anchor Q domain-containing protein [Pseudomonadota bacterium]